MLRLSNVHKSYDSGGKPLHVLKGIDLCIETGEFVSIMGHSGSGKSTLLNILGLLDHYVEVETGTQQFEKRTVELGVSDGIHVEIKSGLTEDDNVKQPYLPVKYLKKIQRQP